MYIFVNISTSFQLLLMDTIFEQFLLENSFPWSNIQLKAKSVRVQALLAQALMCIFVIIFHVFKKNGCLWILFLNSFYWIIHSHGQNSKLQIKAKIEHARKHFQALMCIFVHISHFFFFKWLFMDTIFEQFLLENLFPQS